MEYLQTMFAENTPKVGFSFFEPMEQSSMSVQINPTGLGNLTITENTDHVFGFNIIVRTTKQTKDAAYGDVLTLIRLVVNFVEMMAKRKSLTFTINSVINNSNEATLTLAIRKRL